jgi:peptidoglycan/xylan/chitin deacetylase (PgdA/CDA1 family)
MIELLRPMLETVLKGYRALRQVPSTSAEQDAVKVGPDTEHPLLSSYGELCKNLHIDRLYLVLSFDCDTVEDASAAERLVPYLSQRGIIATLFVPGEQLLQKAATYRKLANFGVPFANHGALPHAERTELRYHATTFYDKMTAEEVVRDIEEGHCIVEGTIGKPPHGFRAPHFGCYQAPDQLALIYRTARLLGYSFCTTTLPALGLERGPVFPMSDGLYEFPVSGSVRLPTTVFDSWNSLADYEKLILKDEYYSLFVESVDFFLRNRLPGVLNWYVDPAHVVDSPPFLRAIDYALSKKIRFVNYPELIALIEG